MGGRVEIGAATEEDFKLLTTARFGVPQALPHRAMAIAVRLEGRVLGIGGIVFAPEGGRWAFADISDEGRKYPITMHKVALMTMRMARERGIRRLVATAETHPAGGRWLRRLGFVPREVNGITVYVRDF